MLDMNFKALFILALAACDSGPKPPPDAVTVFAATSLKEAVTDVAGAWSKKAGRPVKLQFESSSTLARQIKEGAPADLFLTAAPEWLDAIKVLDRFDWLSNRLVVVVRKETPEVDLRKLDSLALANEQAPAGKYAKAALAHQGVRLPDRTIYGSTVRDVLSKVSQGGAQAGIVYATDAGIDPDVRVAFTFPPESHPKILYSAGLLAPAGKALFDALREPWAIEAARRHGFIELK
jgi:molybdate transport system substrate-binding protein